MGDDDYFLVADLGNHSPVADPVTPIHSEVAGQSFATLSRVIELTDLVEMRPDPAQYRAVKTPGSLVELRGSPQLPLRHRPNSSHRAWAGWLSLPVSSQSRTMESAQNRSSRSSRCSWIASRI